MGGILGLVILTLTAAHPGHDMAASTGPWLGSPAAAIRQEIRTAGLEPEDADTLLARCSDPAPYREILFYDDGPAVRVAARCLVMLKDRTSIQKILGLAQAGDLGPHGYPAALFGWIVGASYDASLLRDIRRLLSSQDTHTRIFALEAARTLTLLRWRMPETEPRFANPGEVWAMRRWCYKFTGKNANPWLRERARPVLRRLPPSERLAAGRFFSRFLAE